jgi:xylulose-5-phosphate/fructose-6-phosphate phosphoketolase
MRAQKPEELFDQNGKLIRNSRNSRQPGQRRMSANPHANGGILKKALRLPPFSDYAVKVDRPGSIEAENVAALGTFLRDVMKLNMTNFRVFGPTKPLPTSCRQSTRPPRNSGLREYFPEDQDGTELAPDGRVVEMLSEHTMEGMLEGYLLTGRNGFISSYEAFVHVIDSMFNQHAKWLSICNHLLLAAPHRVAEPADHFHGLAAGSQRLHASGPRISSTWC